MISSAQVFLLDVRPSIFLGHRPVVPCLCFEWMNEWKVCLRLQHKWMNYFKSKSKHHLVPFKLLPCWSLWQQLHLRLSFLPLLLCDVAALQDKVNIASKCSGDLARLPQRPRSRRPLQRRRFIGSSSRPGFVLSGHQRPARETGGLISVQPKKPLRASARQTCLQPERPVVLKRGTSENSCKQREIKAAKCLQRYY